MENYMIYEVDGKSLYIPRGIELWLTYHPEEEEIFEE